MKINDVQAAALKSAADAGIPKPQHGHTVDSGTLVLTWVFGPFKIALDLRPNGDISTTFDTGTSDPTGVLLDISLMTQVLTFIVKLQEAFAVTSGVYTVSNERHDELPDDQSDRPSGPAEAGAGGLQLGDEGHR